MDTAIKLDSEFKEWLKRKGKKCETYQDIIKRLIKKKEVKNERK